MRRVIIESPYACDVERNLEYLRACLHDSIMRGEAPYASHGLYTQPGVLDDNDPEERRRGIEAGFAWWEDADRVVFYTDLGWSRGMLAAKERAIEREEVFEYRQLGGKWAPMIRGTP
jgi:hypothetical protein